MKRWISALLFLISINSFAQEIRPEGPAWPGSGKPATLSQPDSAGQSAGFRDSNHRREHQIIGKSLFIASAGAGLGLAGYGFVDEPLRTFTLSHRNEETFEITQYITPFGNSKYMIPVSAAVYVSGLAIRNPKMQRTGLLLTSTLFLNDFVTRKLKVEFQRSRPDEAEHNYYFAGGEGGKHHLSFPSAHTSTAFAFATSVATIYGDHKWVPPVAYGAATLVGLSRIHDNKHWTTDVMGGAAVGFLTAKATYFLFNQVEGQLAKRNVQIYLSPKVSTGTTGLNISATF